MSSAPHPQHRRPRIGVVGNAVVDLYLHGLSAWPGDGERAHVERIQTHAAGNGLNIAANLVALDETDVLLLTAVGEDEHGALIRREAAGAELIAAPVRPGDRTSLSIVRLDGASPSFAHAPGAAGRITAVFLRGHLDALIRCDAVIVASLGLLPGLEMRELAGVLADLRRANPAAVVIADPVLLAEEGRAASLATGLSELLPHVDYFVPNEAEAAQWTGLAPAEGMRWIADRAHRGAVIKRGSAGVRLRMRADGGDGGDGRDIPAEPLDGAGVADTTGAGDAWVSGFACAIVRGADAAVACRVGNAAAAVCVRYAGSTGFMPRYHDLLGRFSPC